ncbi:metal ABC transporter ATP-binding protein [Glutamicibacter sp. NPDC087344]|uniref:metal ABC transporter ATP-binding protein n=1 Tax=Glutamicibacter sp. NPDC087344 TaxID=3363994 RepID=UPI0037FADAD3
MSQSLPKLTASHLAFSYGDRAILTDLSVKLHPGELTAIIGPNGSGKSTLLGLLAGYLKPTAGTLVRSGTTALVLQRPNPAPGLLLSARDAVAMGLWGLPTPRREANRRITEALSRVDLLEKARKPFASLSGGQQQRALLAQALVRQADILLLDEPTTGIDVQNQQVLQRLLKEEALRGAAIGLVTHNPQAAAQADAVLDLSSSTPQLCHQSETLRMDQVI